MADVVHVARERRARLIAEISRLDDFIRMATALAKSGGGEAPEELLDALSRDAETAPEDELLLTDPVAKAAKANAEPAPPSAIGGGVTETDIQVGKMIRHRRWMMGMSQEQLAQRVGLRLDYIQDYETGVRRVGTSVLRNIALAMDVPTSFFYQDADKAGDGDDEFLDNILTEK